MESILMNRGYIKSDIPNEWKKNDWTIRLQDDHIEIFNNPDKNEGKYYYGPIKKVDIEQLLIEIDEFNY